MAAAEVTQQPTVEEVLGRESERGPRAGLLAIVAGVLVLLGSLLPGFLFTDFPRVPLLDTLRYADGQELGRPGLRTAQVLYYDDNAVLYVVSAVIVAIGALCAGAALLYLFEATRARRPEAPRWLRLIIMFGAVAFAVGTLMGTIALVVKAGSFASAEDQGTEAARDVISSGPRLAGLTVAFFGGFALALSYVLVALNAMRAGLLTRFMGILGIIVGILPVLLPGQPPVPQAFWLIALGFLLMGRWPSGLPPAWQTGRAEPWPTQQELREQRERAAGRPAPAAAGPGPDAVAGPAGEPSPATSRKRRKRRG